MTAATDLLSPGSATGATFTESRSASRLFWERFRDDTLVPRMQAGIAGGFAGPPQETEIDIDTLMP